MDPVVVFLVSVAAILLIGAGGEIIFQRTNIPDVIWLILAGVVIGPVLEIVTRQRLNAIAPYFAALTLVVVLFEGGSALRLGELSHAAPRSVLLALTGFLFSVAAMAAASKLASLVGLLPPSWTWLHGVLLGCILGGSSSIIIMPAMAHARVKPGLANLVNLESALTDAFCVIGTSALIDVMLRGASGMAEPVLALGRSFGIGIAVGGVAGFAWLLFLRFLHSSEHAYPVTLSALLILYVLIGRLGGSPALGILTVAVILGNASALGKKIGLSHDIDLSSDVRGFHRQLAFMIKSFFFVFIGAMLGPPASSVVLGIAFGVVLLGARVPAVYLALAGSSLESSEKKLTTVALPRGMAAGVLATLPVSAGVVATEQLPVIVFACVFTTIAVFAVGFPVFKRRVPVVSAGVGGTVPLPAGAARPSMMDSGADTVIDVVPGGGAATEGALRPSYPLGFRQREVSPPSEASAPEQTGRGPGSAHEKR